MNRIPKVKTSFKNNVDWTPKGDNEQVHGQLKQISVRLIMDTHPDGVTGLRSSDQVFQNTEDEVGQRPGTEADTAGRLVELQLKCLETRTRTGDTLIEVSKRDSFRLIE